MCFLLHLWAFCQILALFTMSAHQIWPCHVTQDSNFENYLFCPNFTFNIRKNHKISSRIALYFRRYRQKPHGGGGGGNTPPVPLGLRFVNTSSTGEE